MMQSAGGTSSPGRHAEKLDRAHAGLDQRVGQVGGAGEIVSYTPEQQAHGRNPRMR
jgi:hypothetical protein